jgi:hypothetical protein
MLNTIACVGMAGVVDVYCDPEGDALCRKYNIYYFAGNNGKSSKAMIRYKPALKYGIFLPY